MSRDLDIRPIKDSEFSPLCALYCKSVKCNPQGFIQDLDYHGCLIAKTREWREAGGEMLAGFVGKELVSLGGLAPKTDNRIELCKLHVDTSWQGQGFGRLMSEALISLAHMRGFAEIILHVTVTQKAAIGLYHSLGFEPVKQNLFQTRILDRPVSFDTLHMRMPLGLPQKKSAQSQLEERSNLPG